MKIERTKLGVTFGALLFLLTACGAPVAEGGGSGGANPNIPGSGSTSEFWMGVQVDVKGDNKPRYVVRRSEFVADGGDPNGSSIEGVKCVAEPGTSTEDIFCIAHADELDLQFHNIKLVGNAPAAKCEYTSFVPSWYWNLPGGDGFTGSVYSFINADGLLISDASFVDIYDEVNTAAGGDDFRSTGTFAIDLDGDATTSAFGEVISADGFAGPGVKFKNDGTPVCAWDYTTRFGDNQGPNCCEGEYTHVTATESEGGTAVGNVTNELEQSESPLAADDEIRIHTSTAADVTEGAIYTIATFSTNDATGVSTFTLSGPNRGSPFGADDGATFAAGETITFAKINFETDGEAKWEGEFEKCAKGPGTQFGPKTEAGIPAGVVHHVPEGYATETFENNKQIGFIGDWNFETANFFQSQDGVDFDPDLDTTWATAHRPPGDFVTAGGTDLGDWGATSLAAEPLFTYECLDRDLEVKARIRFAVMDWNTKDELTDFLNNSDETATPDEGTDFTETDNLEGTPFNYSPENDMADFEDLDAYFDVPYVQEENTLGGFFEDVDFDGVQEPYPAIVVEALAIGGASASALSVNADTSSNRSAIAEINGLVSGFFSLSQKLQQLFYKDPLLALKPRQTPRNLWIPDRPYLERWKKKNRGI